LSVALIVVPASLVFAGLPLGLTLSAWHTPVETQRTISKHPILCMT
jgi:hypothetical protein